ncbi:MAG: ATP-binding protein [Myxococcota bacterium]
MTWASVHLLASASGLVVVVLALTRGEGSPLRRPLALLAASQFLWNAAALGHTLTQLDTFALLGAIGSPLFPPIALDFVLTFLGRRRQHRKLMWGVWAIFGAQAVLPAVEIAARGTVPGGLHTFATLLLGASIPVAVFAMVLVVKHLRRTGSELERLRTRVLLLALVVVVALLVTDPLADLDLPVPRLATLGSFSFNALLTHLTLGLGLFRRGERGGLGQAIVLGLFFTVAYLTLFVSFSGRTAVLLTALIALSLLLAVLGWLYFRSSRQARAGLERFAALGRFSAQMAHDLKNPLAAAKGAAEFLAEEMRRAGGGPNHDFALLVVQQLDRLHAVIDRYQRLSKLEPQLAELDANQLVTKVLSLQRFATGASVTLTPKLGEPAPKFLGDADLPASALENLVKNAYEAMPSGGTLTVSTSLTLDDDEPGVELSVSDTGTGLDARAREQAFELFFTTKATGSGLGLAFVRQVARAHGGEATLTSREGEGTTVTLRLPVRPVLEA